MHDVTETDFTELAINPDRFCEGISKIGYRPAAAIMDIIDNSIAAGASLIEVEFVVKAGVTNSSSGNVEMYQIFDNGSGMSSSEIDKALEIGSDVEYPTNSLSKFGFGLKSAGFSLGRRIQVTSKARSESSSKFVDRDVIRERRQYGVCSGSVGNSAEQWLRNNSSGTVIEVSKTAPKQDSAAKIRRELLNRLGVIYYEFLTRRHDPLRIVLRVGGEVEHVLPIDILFWDEAADQFDADIYDAKTPVRVYEGSVADDLLSGSDKIVLQIVVFPMDKMKSYPGFSSVEQKRISSYLIKRENSGMFFYRNGRLIRWGDKLAGVSRDDINFRAKISFTTAHDDTLHVDVSKQHLELNEDFESKLSLLCKVPLITAKEVFGICNKMLQLGTGTEGQEFNERTDAFEETDPLDEVASTNISTKVERRFILANETEERALEEVDEPGSEGDIATLPAAPLFQRIRYSDKIIGLDVAIPGTDRSEGTFVRINRNHPFYSVVLNGFEASSTARLTLEAMLWAGAVAEMKTSENLSELSFEQLRDVFAHYRTVLSQTLNAWVMRNQDLFS